MFALEEGDCFDDPEVSTDIRAVPPVACDQPHDNEVFATFDLVGATYPGGEALEDEALAGCTDRFPGQVDARFAEADLVIGVLVPTRDSWEDGDREVVCVVSSPDGLLTGSLLAGED